MLENLIRFSYPYPIAATYQNIESIVYPDEMPHKYNRLIDLYDSILKVLNFFLMGFSLDIGLSNEGLKNQLETTLKNPIPSSWTDLLAKLISDLEDTNDPLVHGIQNFYYNSDVSLPGIESAVDFMLDKLGQDKEHPFMNIAIFFEVYNRFISESYTTGFDYEQSIRSLLPAFKEVLLRLEFLKNYALVYTSSIQVEGPNYDHNLILMSGLAHTRKRYISDTPLKERNRKIYVFDVTPEGLKPKFCLHPFVAVHKCGIHNKDEIYFLRYRCGTEMDYYCFQCRERFRPDSFLTDYRDAIEGMVEGSAVAPSDDAIEVYREILKTAWKDGVLNDEERSKLEFLREHLKISESLARNMEDQILLEYGMTGIELNLNLVRKYEKLFRNSIIKNTISPKLQDIINRYKERTGFPDEFARKLESRIWYEEGLKNQFSGDTESAGTCFLNAHILDNTNMAAVEKVKKFFGPEKIITSNKRSDMSALLDTVVNSPEHRPRSVDMAKDPEKQKKAQHSDDAVTAELVSPEPASTPQIKDFKNVINDTVVLEVPRERIVKEPMVKIVEPLAIAKNHSRIFKAPRTSVSEDEQRPHRRTPSVKRKEYYQELPIISSMELPQPNSSIEPDEQEYTQVQRSSFSDHLMGVEETAMYSSIEDEINNVTYEEMMQFENCNSADEAAVYEDEGAYLNENELVEYHGSEISGYDEADTEELNIEDIKDEIPLEKFEQIIGESFDINYESGERELVYSADNDYNIEQEVADSNNLSLDNFTGHVSDGETLQKTTATANEFTQNNVFSADFDAFHIQDLLDSDLMHDMDEKILQVEEEQEEDIISPTERLNIKKDFPAIRRSSVDNEIDSGIDKDEIQEIEQADEIISQGEDINTLPDEIEEVEENNEAYQEQIASEMIEPAAATDRLSMPAKRFEADFDTISPDEDEDMVDEEAIIKSSFALADFFPAIEEIDEKKRQSYIKAVSIQLNRAKQLLQAEKFTEAKEILSWIIRVDSKNLVAMLLRGHCAIQEEDYAQAYADLDTVMQVKKDDVTLLMLHGKSALKIGKYETALEDFNKIIGRSPQNSSAYLARGFVYYEIGDYRKAILDFDKVIAESPVEADAYIKRGNCWMELGEFEFALDDYKQASDREPDNIYGIYKQGLAYTCMRSFGNAAECFDRAIKIEPDENVYYLSRSTALFELGKFSQALDDVSKVLKSEPKNPEALLLKGKVCEFIDKRKDAIESYSHLATIAGYEAEGYAERGRLYANFNKMNQAFEDFEIALAASPSHIKTRMYKADALVQAGSYEEAIQIYTEALSINPSLAEGYLHRGIAYEKDGDIEQAKENFEYYLQLNRL